MICSLPSDVGITLQQVVAPYSASWTRRIHGCVSASACGLMHRTLVIWDIFVILFSCTNDLIILFLLCCMLPFLHLIAFSCCFPFYAFMLFWMFFSFLWMFLRDMCYVFRDRLGHRDSLENQGNVAMKGQLVLLAHLDYRSVLLSLIFSETMPLSQRECFVCCKIWLSCVFQKFIRIAL